MSVMELSDLPTITSCILKIHNVGQQWEYKFRHVDKQVTITQTKKLSLAILISEDGETYIMSHGAASTYLADSKWFALNHIKAKSNKEKRSSKQPGMDFLCPPMLVDMLRHHWKDIQDGFSDPAELNKILVFQSDELRWTAQKRGEFDEELEADDDDGNEYNV